MIIINYEIRFENQSIRKPKLKKLTINFLDKFGDAVRLMVLIQLCLQLVTVMF